MKKLIKEGKRIGAAGILALSVIGPGVLELLTDEVVQSQILTLFGVGGGTAAAALVILSKINAVIEKEKK
jgi:hypothetical protein